MKDATPSSTESGQGMPFPLPADERPSERPTRGSSAPVSSVRSSEEEVDLWWGAYAGRKMLPEFVLCGIVTALLFAMAWYFRTWHGNVVRYLVQLAMGAVWLSELAKWAYRLVACGYRLTTRRVLHYYGLFQPIRRELELRTLATIQVEQSFFDRLLGVGRVVVHARDDSLPVVFDAVRRPTAVAVEIDRRSEMARAACKSNVGGST